MSASKVPTTESGRLLRELLRARGETQASVSAKSESKISQATFSQYSNGSRVPGAEWLNLIAETMALSPEEEVKLHTAAAIDSGYKLDLDLTKK